MVMSKKNSHQVEILYESASDLRRPMQLFKVMIWDLLASRDLAWRLMVRDLRSQYRQSLLGFFWAFIPPVVAALGLTLANNANILNIGKTDIPYPAYVMFSMALWQTFLDSLNGPIRAVSLAKPMLVRINFPREAIILSQLGQVFFNFGIKLLLILALFIWFKIAVVSSVILSPVALVHMVALGTGIGLFLAPLSTLYEDFSKGLTLFAGVWFILTPVIYPVPQTGVFASLVQLNPVTPLLVTTRELVISGNISDPQGFWVASAIAITALLGGWLFYRIAMPFVIERISA
jgi:lipopolysaccharide transport system permease protein